MQLYKKVKTSKRVEMGDIINHPQFATAVQSSTQSHLVITKYSVALVEILLAENIPLNDHLNDHFRYDESRGNAWFVVEETKLEPENFIHQHGKENSSPHRLIVLARRLKPEYEFDPEGEVIEFTQLLREDGSFIEEVNVAGKMQRYFR